jgi:ActR/RegA family two-component response regulator
MRPIDAVLAHHDAASVERLATSLKSEFRTIAIVRSSEEICAAVARVRAAFAVVDLELVSLAELKELCARFPATAFVCIHRLADDCMWAEALAAGAVDCCQSNDVRGILLASNRHTVLNRVHRAAA